MQDIFEEIAYRQQGGATLVNHRHRNPDSYEIIQVLGGAGSAFILDRTYPFSAGTLLMIDAASLHCITPRDVSGYNRSKLIIGKQYLRGIFGAMQALDVLDGIFEPHAGGCFYLNDGQTRQADALFRSMEGASGDGGERSLQVVAALLGLISLCAGATRPVMPRADDKLAPAMQYIRTHYAEPITLEQVASEAHMSKYHLCRLFRRQTGLTLMQYMYEQRISAARRLLTLTDMPISAIAQNCGFASSSHFCTLFRRHEGMAPRDYRRRGGRTL